MTHCGMLGRAFGDCVKLTMSSFKEIVRMYETYGVFRVEEYIRRKGRHQDGLGRNKQVKIEVRGDKRGWLCVNRLLVSALV